MQQRMITNAQAQALEGLMKYGGVALERYMASKLPPGAEDPKMAQLTGFMRTLEPVQFMAIYGMLTDEQREKFAPIASGIVSVMPEEKKQLLGSLLFAYNADQEAKKAASEIRVTVQEEQGDEK